MGLEAYKKKRDFARTPEPKGKLRAGRRRQSFVVQKHAASRLHYDFRLEHAGVLLSWAVPKGPSLDPAQKRLAVHVEDHPVEYGGFEGVIPPGEYGAGSVLLWDRGTWQPDGDPTEGLRKGKLVFRLDGKKLAGAFSLVRMRATDGDRENWLLVKSRDEHARSQAEYDVTVERPESVASGRDIDEIAGPRARRWSADLAPKNGGAGRSPVAQRYGRSAARSAPSTASRAKSRAKRTSAKGDAASRLAGARAARLPAFVEPELATLVREAPAGPEWIHETKFDGYRTLCRLDDGRVRWLTRSGLDWTARFEELSPAASELRARTALLDGEIVAVRPDGTADFQLLQNALRSRGETKLTYFAFDLLHLDGYDLRASPLFERKALLAELLRGARGTIRYSDHVEGQGSRFFAQACAHALEGIVSKRSAQPYRSGRQRDWLKVKCGHRQEFVVGGWTDPRGSRVGIGALLLGYHDGEGRLKFAGRVGTGFGVATAKGLLAKLREVRQPPFEDPPRGAEARGVHWARPTNVVEIEFTGWTSDGKLRHPSFEGLREDKEAVGVVREVAMNGRESAAPQPRAKKRGPRKRTAGSQRSAATRAEPSSDEVAGVRLTHPDRVLYPGQGITKLDLARYYERVADRILPHVAGRPLSFVRCPRGEGEECFYQRHPGQGFSEHLKRVPDPASGRTYVWLDSLPGLIALVQMGVLELHPWGSRVEDLDHPDRMFFDLDPDPAVGWKRVVEAAQLVHDFLGELGLESFLKTTGGKGLHVVVPLVRRHGWEEVKEFSAAVARHIERAAPELYLSKASKSARKGKIYVDWLRNARAATAVAAYSTRARPGAPVSLPLTWKELQRVEGSAAFSIADVPPRLARQKRDPWNELGGTKQSITAKARRSLGLPAR